MPERIVLKGASHTTGTVHYARQVKHRSSEVTVPMLAQRCGMTYRAIAYLSPVAADTAVTCRRCLANPPAGLPVPRCDPYRVVRLVAEELSADNVKITFTGREFGEARPHAEGLLRALGVAPLVGIAGVGVDR